MWHYKNDLEPVVGHPDCPELADEYGIAGASCYTVFVEINEDGTYGCRYERCFPFQFSSLDDAIRHLRDYHFGHQPFVCDPCSRKSWYVPTILFYPLTIPFLLLYPGCQCTHDVLAAINDSLLRMTWSAISDVVRNWKPCYVRSSVQNVF